MTQACSHVKCAKVKLFSSFASSARLFVGVGKLSSILFEDGGDELDIDRDAGRFIGQEYHI